ncbi:hypothetical protein Xmau_02635 [Xenorhabdus mauleonii]|uniref:TPM domain-containing protein n=1 Tax=Xenorhabdus mauleonii TaxID=351675 RepID=A0A1I3URG2_9GAMM|nr:TPM domain-containing protein [Xenorhabdus mauleonii]PHM39627.1 hypothetical protein Xmau_02635 [Xenorhabdus mauleonii]SFJ84367.1 uncharacterized protein SAMN05421680_11782 [Xenorhabdus mauleonii]
MSVIARMPKDGRSTRMIQPVSRYFSMMKHVVILFLLLIGIGNVSAKELNQKTTSVEIPVLNKHVVDTANVLTKEEKQRLTRKLKKLQSEEKVQMAVLIIPTLGGETVEEFSSRVFAKWKLGSTEHNDGILFLVASADHQMRISVGSGLEHKLTDGKVARILRQDVKPAFKEDAYFEGLSNSIDSIETLLKQPGQMETPSDIAKTVQAFEEDNASSDSSLGKDLTAPLVLYLLGMISLPLAVFREGHWAKRFLKCTLTVAAATFVLSLVGVFPPLSIWYYLLIFLLPVILALLVIFSLLSLVGGMVKKLFGGLFGGSSSQTQPPAESIKIKNEDDSDDDDNDRFIGGGGKSEGGGASGSW